MNTTKRWRCNDCDGVTTETALLHAPNPFDPQDQIVGCPVCKGIGPFTELCDEPGCDRTTSCGFPTPDGYRRTCYEHSKGK